MSSPAHSCPECASETLVRTEKGGRDFRCFNCNVTYDKDEIETCVECGELFGIETGDDGVICPACFDYKINKD
jgi:DNA-directed RNA polymerase subunit RPC12/RpoP